ncbi:alpha/beta hydrolase [Hymenobacter sp. BT523]|uniref:alpha/beta hydrolase n=1 Tax=Hymenobacter sp. BT523 TaxID=2795725 RepID=UPI0018EB01A3|nr:alpha/beta hydrolase-fold protein [Hymenobacter sp. BT523]MBJ6110217.1 alpha/beta hydrolase [Hymenobacter sp. BT523]
MRFLRPSILLVLLALPWAGAVRGQAAGAASEAAPLVMGQTFTIASKALGETRRINVYLPAGYAESTTLQLPVLYMPDGGMQEDFLHVAGLVQVSVGNGTMRPFILVGIENTERRRDLTGPTTNEKDKKIAPRVGGSAAYRQFLREELMPAVKKRYRTTAETAIVGESLAGLFVVETLLLEPELFNTYLAFDPSLWWNNGQLAKEASKLPWFTAKSSQPKTVFLATSRDGDPDVVSQLAKLLNSKPGGRITAYSEAMPQESHATIYHPAALKAFRTVFKPAPSEGK